MKTRTKPAKPYDEFPLFAHQNGQWAKKIRGKMHYFGSWDSPESAAAKYLAERDALQVGRTPKVSPTPEEVGPTVRDLCNRFMTSKKILLTSHDLAARTFNDYYMTCESLIEYFGAEKPILTLEVADFEDLRSHLAKSDTGGMVGPVTLGNRIRYARIVFKYASDAELIEHPINFGPGFKLPSKKRLRASKNAQEEKLFEPHELVQLITAAKPVLRAMILLGINCGFGNTDISKLPLTAVDLESGWIKYPRPKTAILRRCPLWPETVKALRDALAARPVPRRDDLQDRFFITKYGSEFVKIGQTMSKIDGLAQEFRRLKIKEKLNRSQTGFYTLRHTFETIGGDPGDQVAVDYIMGHAPESSDMAAIYRARVFDARLKKVVDHVRQWLWPNGSTGLL